MAATITLATKPEGILLAKYDAAFQRAVCPDGILTGVTNATLTQPSGGQWTFGVNGGTVIVCGRVIHIGDSTIEGVTQSSSYIGIKVTNTIAEFVALTAGEGGSFPSLTQEDINLNTAEGISYTVLLASLNFTAPSASIILPRVNMCGIYYGTEVPPTNYPFRDGVFYARYEAQ